MLKSQRFEVYSIYTTIDEYSCRDKELFDSFEDAKAHICDYGDWFLSPGTTSIVHYLYGAPYKTRIAVQKWHFSKGQMDGHEVLSREALELCPSFNEAKYWQARINKDVRTLFKMPPAVYADPEYVNTLCYNTRMHTNANSKYDTMFGLRYETIYAHIWKKALELKGINIQCKSAITDTTSAYLLCHVAMCVAMKLHDNLCETSNSAVDNEMADELVKTAVLNPKKFGCETSRDIVMQAILASRDMNPDIISCFKMSKDIVSLFEVINKL